MASHFQENRTRHPQHWLLPRPILADVCTYIDTNLTEKLTLLALATRAMHRLWAHARARAQTSRAGGRTSAREAERKLEQMRAMDNGMRIVVVRVDTVPLGVDTPSELETARRMLRKA